MKAVPFFGYRLRCTLHRRRRREILLAQAKASMAASFRHFTIWQLAQTQILHRPTSLRFVRRQNKPTMDRKL